MTTPLEGVLTQALEAAARAAPQPPPDLVEDVNGAVKRRRRQRYLAAASVVLAVATMAAVTVIRIALPPPLWWDAGTATATVVTDSTCTVRALPSPPPVPGEEPRVTAGAIDPTGRYVVGHTTAYLTAGALLWVDGELQAMGTPYDAYATGVNAAGTVVGSTANGGWVYRDGKVSRLPTLPGSDIATPTAINFAGDIAGQSGPQAVIWPSDQPGQVRPVGGEDAAIIDLSDEGLMLGYDRGGARLWNRDGTLHTQPPGFKARLIAGVWVLGEVGSGVGDVRYALWNLTTGALTRLVVDGAGPSGYVPVDLSDSGAVLIGVTSGHGSGYAVVRDGKAILLPGDSDLTAGSMSGDGRTIVGTDGARALLWRC